MVPPKDERAGGGPQPMTSPPLEKGAADRDLAPEGGDALVTSRVRGDRSSIDEPSPLGTEVLALGGAVAALASVDVAAQPGSLLVAETRELLMLSARLSGHVALRLAAAHRCDATLHVTARSLSGFLTEDVGVSVARSTALRRLAARLPLAPRVETSLLAGLVSEEAAAAVLSAVVAVPEADRPLVEEVLLDLATTAGVTVRDVLRVGAEAAARARALAAQEDPDGPTAADDAAQEAAQAAAHDAQARAHLDLYQVLDGMWHVRGLLSPEGGEALRLALAALTDAPPPRPPGQPPLDPDAEPDPQTETGWSVDDDHRGLPARRADALGRLADAYLAHGDPPDTGGERPRIVVTMTLDQLEERARAAYEARPDLFGGASHPRTARADHDGEAAPVSAPGPWPPGPSAGPPGARGFCRLGDGTPLSPAVARRLACDAGFLPVVLRGDGEVLDVGQTESGWPAAVRRAANVRAGGRCETPDCSRPPVELHHLHHRAHGGPSGLDNAAALCGLHHWLIHHQPEHWQLHRTPAGLVLQRGDGTLVRGPGHTSTRAGPGSTRPGDGSPGSGGHRGSGGNRGSGRDTDEPP